MTAEPNTSTSTVQYSSALANISEVPKEPLALFQELLTHNTAKFTTMNLATLDDEFGVLNRTVTYRDIVDGAIVYVTEKNTRNYDKIIKNNRLCVTFLLSDVRNPTTGQLELWQVRLLDAKAVELHGKQLQKFWAEEEPSAKIRSYICKCGERMDHAKLQQQHDELLQQYKSGQHQLEQTQTYTAFKIIPQRWDFYKSEPHKIADRVQYRRAEGATDQWKILHIAT